VRIVTYPSSSAVLPPNPVPWLTGEGGAGRRRTFGGFHMHSWNAVKKRPVAGTYDTTASQDFIFRLAPGSPAVHRPGGPRARYHEYAYEAPSSWPTFGGGNDLTFGNYGSSSGKLGGNAYCHGGASYTSLTGRYRDWHLCSGGSERDGRHWGATQMEVWGRAS
jgi:hypothetical protein